MKYPARSDVFVEVYTKAVYSGPMRPAPHLLLSALVTTFGLVVSSRGGEAPEVWLDLLSPVEGALVRSVAPFVEVRGRAGAGEPIYHDVVVALDVSGTTFRPTGTDLDRDGILGEFRPRAELKRRKPWEWTTDLDDTVIAAEIEATRALIDRLDPERTRLGLVVFHGTAARRASVGRAASALSRVTLDEAVDWARRMRSGTNLAAALAVSLETLTSGGTEHKELRRVVLLVSDGQDEVPEVRSFGGDEDIQRMEWLALTEGVRVYTFGVGPLAIQSPYTLEEIAAKTGGRYVEVEDPAAVRHELPRIQFAGLEAVEVRNQTSGKEGRALRVSPDGSFDAYVPLIEGSNRIFLSARLDSGRTVEKQLRVEYQRPEEPTELEELQAEHLLRKLRQRSLEVELATLARSGARLARERELKIEVEK